MAALAESRPAAVVVPGWSSPAALALYAAATRLAVPVVVMSESNAFDEPRFGFSEWIKRRVVGRCATALVGGQSHRDYLNELGMASERIFLGYDAVDNGYFARGAKEVRSRGAEIPNYHGLPNRYFLASARFIEKKNLSRLIQAYARYRELAGESAIHGPQSAIWSLVLLGDGPLRETLNSQLSALNLHAHVQLPGFRQYPDLPAYYGLAGAFIHASTTEQWGLVVNEAMASGLPVLVSNRCGCAADLVQEGHNGFTFDPLDVEQIARLMRKVSAVDFPLSDFGAASARLISNFGPDRFAAGLKAAVECAVKVGLKRSSLVDRALLKSLMFTR
jgi:1,2-diacylglycerol 3-alpha-glucosyltransferase